MRVKIHMPVKMNIANTNEAKPMFSKGDIM